jgi:hypothetical protein
LLKIGDEQVPGPFRTALTTVVDTVLEMLNKTDSANDVMLEIHHVGYYEDVSPIVGTLQYYYKNEDCEESTVEQISGKHQNTSADQATSEDDTTERC